MRQPKNDAEQIKKACIEVLNINPDDIHMFIDKKSKLVTDNYHLHFKNKSKALSDSLDAHGVEKLNNEYGQFLIFYSGHGKTVGTKTFGIDEDGNDIDLEKFVTDISVRRN